MMNIGKSEASASSTVVRSEIGQPALAPSAVFSHGKEAIRVLSESACVGAGEKMEAMTWG
nr:hypothetical protein BV87_26295 [Sphingobium yanoikuyae]